MIPIAHDFTGETVLVVGGGPVGARKARHFASEADVVVVSPEFADGAFGRFARIRAAVGPADAADWVDRTDPALVVTATDAPAVNDALAEAAAAAGALVNRADGGSEGVDVPATAEDGPVTVAVSTDGHSPALSGYLRERFEAEWADAGAMARLASDLRTELADRGVPADERHEAMRAVVRSDAVWTALDSSTDNARQVALSVIESSTGDPA